MAYTTKVGHLDMQGADLNAFLAKHYPNEKRLKAFYTGWDGNVTVMLGNGMQRVFPVDMCVSLEGVAQMILGFAKQMIAARDATKIHPTAKHRRRFRTKARSIVVNRRAVLVGMRP